MKQPLVYIFSLKIHLIVFHLSHSNQESIFLNTYQNGAPTLFEADTQMESKFYIFKPLSSLLKVGYLQAYKDSLNNYSNSDHVLNTIFNNASYFMKSQLSL